MTGVYDRSILYANISQMALFVNSELYKLHQISELEYIKYLESVAASIEADRQDMEDEG